MNHVGMMTRNTLVGLRVATAVDRVFLTVGCRVRQQLLLIQLITSLTIYFTVLYCNTAPTVKCLSVRLRSTTAPTTIAQLRSVAPTTVRCLSKSEKAGLSGVSERDRSPGLPSVSSDWKRRRRRRRRRGKDYW